MDIISHGFSIYRENKIERCNDELLNIAPISFCNSVPFNILILLVLVNIGV